MTVEKEKSFVEIINQARKESKGKWYWLDFDVFGLSDTDFKKSYRVRVKGFKTWLQVLRIGPTNELDRYVNHSFNMDMPVKKFLSELQAVSDNYRFSKEEV